MRQTKRCPTCSTMKNVDCFNRDKARLDGLQSQCKECKRIVQQNWYANNKARHVANVSRRRRAAEVDIIKRLIKYLLQHPCVDCGETDPVLLEFDHVRGKKVNSVCNLIRQGFCWDKINSEIQKCEVRCCKCHRLKTAKQFGYRKMLLASTTY
jgi:hypothetical protein